MWTTTSYYSYSPTAIATFKFSSLLPQIIEEEGKPFFYFIFLLLHIPQTTLQFHVGLLDEKLHFRFSQIYTRQQYYYYPQKKTFSEHSTCLIHSFLQNLSMYLLYIYELSLGQCSCSIHQVRVKDIHVFFHSSKAKKQKSKYVMVGT